MKRPNYKRLTLVLTLITASLSAQHSHVSGSDHDHPHAEAKAEPAAPNGGRLVTTVVPHLEFLLLEDRRVEIRAVNDSGEVIPIAEQQVSVIGGDRSQPVRISFVKEGALLLSEGAFPEIEGMPVILQIKPAADAATMREKFYLKTHICSGCNLSEYACTCGH